MSSSPADLPGLPPLPEPVTFARLRDLLTPEGYVLDPSGDALRRRFPHAEVAVSLPAGEGTVLLVGAVRLGTPIPLSRRADLEAFANDWHRERIWPTLVLSATDEALTLHAHVGVDASAGLTRSQLLEYVHVGVATAQQCFSSVEVLQQ